MRSALKVTTAATSLQLLSVEELRAAVGVSGTDQDTLLAAEGLRVAAAITMACNIAVGSGAEPTLLQETLQETFWGVRGAYLILSRRHNIELLDLTVDSTALSIDDVFVDPEAGLITHLWAGNPTPWCASKIVVNYKAGFTTAPGDLKMAAMDFMRLNWADKDRDPSLKSEVIDIPDVRRVERQYWIGSVPGMDNSGPVPDIVAGQLARFRNSVLA